MATNDTGINTEFIQHRFTLYPEKFGVMGQFARELLDYSEAREHFTDMLMGRLTTAVLCGNTVTETPEVVLSMPASPWQHLKDRLNRWAIDNDNSHLAGGGWRWTWFLVPLFLLVFKLIEKRPVQFTEVKAKVTLTQKTLYPEANYAPAALGRPVIYETLDIQYPETSPPYGSHLDNDSSRFLNRHEIARQVFNDDDLGSLHYSYSVGNGQPMTVLLWLERHGVNVDQLVKRQ